MIKALISFYGLKGSFKWACNQMASGKTVYRLRDSGIVKFTYDRGRRRIMAMISWETSIEPHEWGLSMEDVYATDFRILGEGVNYGPLHHEWEDIPIIELYADVCRILQISNDVAGRQLCISLIFSDTNIIAKQLYEIRKS